MIFIDGGVNVSFVAEEVESFSEPKSEKLTTYKKVLIEKIFTRHTGFNR